MGMPMRPPLPLYILPPQPIWGEQPTNYRQTNSHPFHFSFHQERSLALVVKVVCADGHVPSFLEDAGTLDCVPIGGSVLLAHLVELGLDDLHDLGVVWVGLGDVDMQ